MSKKGKLCLALFLALAVIVQYSFAPQGFIAYADDEVTAASTEQAGSNDQTPKDKPKSDPKPESSAPADSGDQGTTPSNDAGPGDESDSGDATTDDNDAVGGTDDPDVVSGEGDVIDDPAEGVVEEEEGVEYPEVTLHANAGGVTVTLHAPEGALPEGAKLSASRVDSQAILNAVEQRVETEDTEMVDAVAIDVTPLDKNGHAVQPKKAVTVTFSGANLAGGDVDVFRVSDDASSVTEMGTSVATSNTQQFSTNHFTIYVASSTGPIDTEHNGENNGSATEKRYVLEHGDTITLASNKSGLDDWDVTAGSSYIQWNESLHTVKNENPTQFDISVTVRHYYFRNIFDWGWEYFYITLKPEKFTVSFYLQDVGDNDFNPIPAEEGGVCEVYKGENATAPDLPETKEGYKLYSWYTDTNCETKATLTNIQASMKVYAKYSTEAKIQYYKNTTDAATVPGEQVGGVGTMVELGTATRAGHVLISWNTKQDGSGQSYEPGKSALMPEGGLKLYAQWDESELTIYYHTDSDNPWRTQAAPNNSRIALIEDMPSSSGEVFLGWSSRNPDDSRTYYPGDTIETGNDDIHLDAVWGDHSLNQLYTMKADSATYTYNGEEQIITSGTVINGDNVTEWDADDEFVYVGRTLFFQFGIYADVRGFKASGVDAGQYATPVSAPLYYKTYLGNLWRIDTNLFPAPYIEIEGGILTINPVDVEVSTGDAEKEYDGEALTKGGEVSFKDNNVTKTVEFAPEGEAVTLVHGETLNIRTTGSQTNVGESENTYEVDWGKPDDWGESASTAKPYNYNITSGTLGTLSVYLGVTFKENAGEDTVTDMPDNLKVTKTDDVTIPDNKPAREGYTFLGWALKDSATQADFQPGDKLTAEDLGNGLILYAVWEAEPTPSPTPTPTPVNPDAGGDGGGGAAAAAAAAAAPAAAAGTTIDQAPTPTTINDNAAPKAANSSWALVNLISALLTALLSLIMLIRYFGKRREENEETGEVTEARSGNGVRLASLIPAIGGIVAFVATENMAGQMAATDKWTVMMVAILAIQAGVAAFAKMKDNYELEDVE